MGVRSTGLSKCYVSFLKTALELRELKHWNVSKKKMDCGTMYKLQTVHDNEVVHMKIPARNTSRSIMVPKTREIARYLIEKIKQ